MVISDVLFDAVLQTLVKLPYCSVAQLIAQIQAELAMQKQALKDTRNEADKPKMTAAESVESARAQFHREADAISRKMGIG